MQKNKKNFKLSLEETEKKEKIFRCLKKIFEAKQLNGIKNVFLKKCKFFRLKLKCVIKKSKLKTIFFFRIRKHSKKLEIEIENFSF